MAKKKAIELSMNFFVVIIISIVIFGFGIKFLYSLAKSANDIQSMSIEDIDSKISNMVCNGNEKICIGTDTKTIKKGDFDVFGIKIVNVADSVDFEIQTTFSKAISKTNSEFSSSNLIINPPDRSVTIEKNDEQSIGIGIEVPKNAISGKYIFNIEIKNSGNMYVPIQKVYVDVP